MKMNKVTLGVEGGIDSHATVLVCISFRLPPEFKENKYVIFSRFSCCRTEFLSAPVNVFDKVCFCSDIS